MSFLTYEHTFYTCVTQYQVTQNYKILSINQLQNLCFLSDEVRRLKGACRAPILLLDDIFDKLDSGRVARIVDYVSGSEFGQIFITDTNRRHLDLILESTCREYRLFTVKDGVIYPDC